MAQYTKTDGTKTVKGADGRIVTNITSASLNGPSCPPGVCVAAAQADNSDVDWFERLNIDPPVNATPTISGTPAENDPPFRKAHPSARVMYTTHFLDPSGGMNHAEGFQTIEDANQWLLEAALNGPAPVADAQQRSLLSGYEIYRRHNNTPDGQWVKRTRIHGGYINVEPVRPGQSAGDRVVGFQELGPSFDGGVFRQKSAEQWAANSRR